MNCKKKIIGVIPLFDEEKDSIWMLPGYMEGIREAGGLPIILPLKAEESEIEQLCEMCDGFLFTGGHDVNPSLYGEEKHAHCGLPNPDRDALEKEVFRIAVEEDKPVFGICRGIQLINALCGGTLYQDLPSEYQGSVPIEHHMTPPYDVACHRVEILPDTPLHKLLGVTTLAVNSYHHQAVKDLAKSLKPMAVSEDGLIEAVYMPDKKFVQAVQWHPEFIYRVDETARKILKSFVDACGV